jgi:hypothetical protein
LLLLSYFFFSTDPFLWFSAKIEAPPSVMLVSGSPTPTTFKFQLGDRMDALNGLRSSFLENYKSLVEGNIVDKKTRSLCCIYGPSGVGKTRLAMEFLNEAIKLPKKAGPDPLANTDPSDRVCVVLDVRHNGYAVIDLEKELNPEVFLGIRLFAHWYFPGSFSNFRDLFFRRVQEWDYHRFGLKHVLRSITKHPRPGASSTPKVLHLVVDEIHTLCQFNVRYVGSKDSETMETMQTSVYRALMNVCFNNPDVRNLYVFPTVVGTVLQIDAFRWPTDVPVITLPLGYFSPSTVRALVDESFSKELRDDKVVQRVIDLCGGSGRALQIVHTILKDQSWQTLQLLPQVINRVGATFNVALTWNRPDSMPFFLAALFGIPLSPSNESQPLKALVNNGALIRQSNKSKRITRASS